mgnify:CR=1
MSKKVHSFPRLKFFIVKLLVGVGMNYKDAVKKVGVSISWYYWMRNK